MDEQNRLGIDIGGTGIKGAPVEVGSGKLLADRFRIPTPQPATPEAVADTVAEIAKQFDWHGPIGATMPGVIKDGVLVTAANIDPSWKGVNAAELFTKATGNPVTVINDADAAGIAEMRFGAGRGHRGVVIMITLGTGIGFALFNDGVLLPNTELGHIEIRGKDAEQRASDRVREADDLSWEKWGGRVDEYLKMIDDLLWPDLVIIGGGVSKKADKFFEYLHPRAELVAATLQNEAGIVGAALVAAARVTDQPGAEAARLAEPLASGWRRWGTYLSERAWGTVREDYSDDGDAWTSFPHDHARSRAYRWSEDGLAGWSDDKQRLCVALALWNGQDPIIKERLFGLASKEGNHGEDAKEQWWFLDNTPTHSYARWRYRYPQAAFPYEQLIEENAARGYGQGEYELADTGVFDHGSWRVEVEHAKAGIDAVAIRIRVRNDGPAEATLHVLPSIWFRNTWSWGLDDRRPELTLTADGAIHASHHELGELALRSEPVAPALFCENETNAERLYGTAGPTYPKDGINDHLVSGAASVNPASTGTKAAFHHQLTLAPGAEAEIVLSLAPTAAPAVDCGSVLADRRCEADAIYATVTPPDASDIERTVMRQAFAGLLWCKQLYHYNVDQWLDGDPALPPPAPGRAAVRNGAWRHMNCMDIISMPDSWEYPWFAAWDLGFHAVALAHVDPEYAKAQLVMLCREWYQHANGQLPAYEWNFGDTNPPVHAWAALMVFQIDGSRDHAFLARVFHKLLLNFTWWVNRKDAALANAPDSNVFEGGFLGLDNIGPFDRSAPPPGGGILEQADGTAWMAKYCLDMLAIALTLADNDPVYEDVATKFFEHFTYIATAAEHLWHEDDGFFEDALHFPDGTEEPLRCRSIVGLIPLTAVALLDADLHRRLANFAMHMDWFEQHKPELTDMVSHAMRPGPAEQRLLSVVSPDRLGRILSKMLDEAEFLSPFGVRSMSRYHLDHPLELGLAGSEYRVDYEPGESTSGLFGGNSNWRGPVWFPPNVLIIDALRRYHQYLGGSFTVELPTGSGRQANLGEAADELARRVVGLIQPDADGAALFHEYFHGDSGAGLGADHQTGWTALVAHLIIGLHSPH